MCGLAEPSLHGGIRLGRHATGDGSSRLDNCRLPSGEILGRDTYAMQIPVEVDSRIVDGLLDELAVALIAPEGCPEGRGAVSAVVLAHDLADCVAGFSSVVEGDGGDEVVQNVRADDVVEEVGVDESEVAVNGGSGTTGEGPGAVVVVREGAVGVLEESDGN